MTFCEFPSIKTDVIASTSLNIRNTTGNFARLTNVYLPDRSCSDDFRCKFRSDLREILNQNSDCACWIKIKLIVKVPDVNIDVGNCINLLTTSITNAIQRSVPKKFPRLPNHVLNLIRIKNFYKRQPSRYLFGQVLYINTLNYASLVSSGVLKFRKELWDRQLSKQQAILKYK